MARLLSSAGAAAALARRLCVVVPPSSSPALLRRCAVAARPSPAVAPRNDDGATRAASGLDAAAAAIRASSGPATHRDAGPVVRHLSSSPVSPPSSSPPPPAAAAAAAVGATNAEQTPPPPSSLTAEAGLGAQDAMRFFIQHGLGRGKLSAIASDSSSTPLVERWQRMISTYLEAQCHVIALLGYRPDEIGISMYAQHMQKAMAMSPPEDQERLRVAMRDTYRLVLAGAFDVPTLLEDQRSRGELSVVDARNIMHKVSLRMLEQDVLEKVRERCDDVSLVATNDGGPEAQHIELARKHTVVQEVMVSDVYLSSSGEGNGSASPSRVEECGFGGGEAGYVRMQCALAEHQNDPLITQYVGSAILRLLQSAGIDMEALQRQVQQQQQ